MAKDRSPSVRDDEQCEGLPKLKLSSGMSESHAAGIAHTQGHRQKGVKRPWASRRAVAAASAGCFS
jgi:hypothetical protein